MKSPAGSKVVGVLSQAIVHHGEVGQPRSVTHWEEQWLQTPEAVQHLTEMLCLLQAWLQRKCFAFFFS